jgi:hypothetical protein
MFIVIVRVRTMVRVITVEMVNALVLNGQRAIILTNKLTAVTASTTLIVCARWPQEKKAFWNAKLATTPKKAVTQNTFIQ